MEQAINAAIQALIACFSAGGKLLICGNGGSSADSDHIVGELMKGFMLPRSLSDRQTEKIRESGAQDWQYISQNLQGALPAISLSAHGALTTAFANDAAADMAFAQQVYGYGKPGDVLWGISTSGNSRNVVYAAQVAKALGMTAIAMTGQSGGRLADICDIAIKAPHDETYRIQEFHLPAYHRICAEVERHFYGNQ